MKFHIEMPPLTGMTDVKDVQNIGRVSGYPDYVVEAETEEEARKKVNGLMIKRGEEARIRPATEDEAQEFVKWQWEDSSLCEAAQRTHEKYANGHGDEQAS